MGGGDPELAETSFLPQPEIRPVPMKNNNAGPTRIQTLGIALAFLCVFTFMLVLRCGKWDGLIRGGVADTAKPCRRLVQLG